jgi:hypothetical protein
MVNVTSTFSTGLELQVEAWNSVKTGTQSTNFLPTKSRLIQDRDSKMVTTGRKQKLCFIK